MKKIFLAFCVAFFGVASVAPMQLHAETASVCNDDVAGKSEEQLKVDLALCNAEIAVWHRLPRCVGQFYIGLVEGSTGAA